MIDLFALWLVQRPLNILAVGVAHLVLWIICRVSLLRDVPQANVFWVPALLWLVYAIWEWLVKVKSPDANIRVDLLLLWPVLAIAMVWSLWRAVRGWRLSRGGKP